MHACMHAYTHVQAHTCAHAHKHAHEQTCMRTCTCAHVRTCTHVQMRTCTHAHTHARENTRAWTHVRTHAKPRGQGGGGGSLCTNRLSRMLPILSRPLRKTPNSCVCENGSLRGNLEMQSWRGTHVSAIMRKDGSKTNADVSGGLA
jgi:hypothetical protein